MSKQYFFFLPEILRQFLGCNGELSRKFERCENRLNFMAIDIERFKWFLWLFQRLSFWFHQSITILRKTGQKTTQQMENGGQKIYTKKKPNDPLLCRKTTLNNHVTNHRKTELIKSHFLYPWIAVTITMIKNTVEESLSGW